MSKRCVGLMLLVALLGSTAYGVFDPLKDPALLGWWPFDEGSGTLAADRSGHGNNGTLNGGATWVPGLYGGALHFNGQNAYVGTGKSLLNGLTGFTMAGWISAGSTGVYASLFGQNDLIELGFTTQNGGQLGTWMLGNNWTFVGTNYTFSYPSWHHVVLAGDRTRISLYVDGQERASDTSGMSSGTSSYFFSIGGNVFNPTGDWFRGEIDDVWLFSRALTAAEIGVLMKGPGGPGQATSPRPADEAVDVACDVTLGWTAGAFAATHDVYLGQTRADVNDAGRTKPAGVLVSQGQTATAYTPAPVLDFGRTYYWRIDEVNQAPDNTIFRGKLWSFTVEPYAYPLTKVTATASSAQAGMGPEKTIDGSGLDRNDGHSNVSTDTWVATGGLPAWIQYQFDKAYQIYDLKVWNSNQPLESFLGLGAKDVTIEYSTDGTTWTTLPGVPRFAQAPGLAGYVANTTVPFGGVSAQYVKLTINSNWGGMSPATGLSEVRFSYIPVQARLPEPAAGATGQAITTTLNWRPGRTAASHQVFFGTDQAAVTNGTAPARTVIGHAFDPGALAYGTTYYWRVDEVNATTYPGDVWSFTTKEFDLVDDFESYDEDSHRLYETWIDGATDGLSGSYVGYNPTAVQLAAGAHFAETTIVHGGKQSMPLAYDNTKTPFYSEATRTFTSAQDWTRNGATHLGLWYRGYPAVAGVTVNANAAGTALSLTGSGTDIWNTSDDFTFAYKTLTGDGAVVARVTDKGAGTNTWAKGGVMMRESLNGSSTFAAMVLSANSDGTASNGYSYQRRLTTGASATSDDGTAPALTVPYYVKVQRAGDNFTGWISADGKTWRQQGTTQTIKMIGPVYVGICVTSHQAGENRTMQFDNIAVTGNVTGSWQGAGINSPRQNDPAGLYVIVQDSSGGKKVVAHWDPAAAATGAWTPWAIALSDLAPVQTDKVQKLTVGAGDRNSPKAGAKGMLFLDDIGFGHPAGK